MLGFEVAGTSLSLSIAFVAGFLTFFASCLLPLVPTFLAYLSGVGLEEKVQHKRWRLFSSALAFVIGFVTIFMVLAATLQKFAFVLAPFKLFLTRASGLVFVFFGLFMLGFFQHRFFLAERRLDVHGWFRSSRYLHAFATGAAFGFGWTPCIGPVLASILFLASQQASATAGMLLLLAYGVGLGLPFLLVALAYEPLLPLIRKSGKFSVWVNRAGGIILILTGTAFLLNKQQYFGYWLLQFIPIENLPI